MDLVFWQASLYNWIKLQTQEIQKLTMEFFRMSFKWTLQMSGWKQFSHEYLDWTNTNGNSVIGQGQKLHFLMCVLFLLQLLYS